MSKKEESYKIDSKVQIGHVHLTVNDLEHSINFYKTILGFEIKQYYPGAIFLSAGGYHHHIAINLWKSQNPKQPQEGHVGLYHYAILYPTKKALANALKNLAKFNYQISGSADHGVSQAIYLNDPDGNGLELYYDKPIADWPKDKDGNLKMYTKPLDLNELLSHAD